ncbi:MAG: hypothetical protein AB7E37_04430 [Candidatus Altimarinota bacterium]
MNKLNSLESREKLTLEAQRELLLQLNPDIIYGVYDLKQDGEGKMELELIDDVMTVYPNQLANIKGLEQTPNMIIVDLGALRKGEFKVIYGKNPDYTRGRGFNSKGGFKTETDSFHTMHITRNSVLLSNGVIEYIEGNTGKPHLITTLRDGGATDSLQRTTTAGRNTGYDLKEEVEREHFEEGPFLGKNSKGEYTLCIPSDNPQGWEYTKESVSSWLENKYNLSRENENDLHFIEAFERNFPGIQYEELGTILRDIVENNRYMTYDWDNKPLDGLDGDMRKLSVEDKGKRSEMNAFVYFDTANNTIEYRDVRRIKGIPEGFQLLGNRPCKLFLESQNQYPRVPRIENAGEKAVPTIKYVSQKVAGIL